MQTMVRETLMAIIAELTSTPGRILSRQDYRISSVLLPVIPGEDIDSSRLLFEKRAPHIPQGGESCFPGGRVDKAETPEEAAFRELREETGVDRASIESQGFFGTLVNPGGRMVQVYIGLIDPETEFQPNEEVDRLFTVSLGQLRDTPISRHQAGVNFHQDVESPIPFSRYGLGHPYTGSWKGAPMEVIFYDGLPELVWGMTAKIARDFVSALYSSRALGKYRDGSG